MALNPLHYSQQVNAQYLRYQLTHHRLTDSVLGDQLKELLWPKITASSPLIKGPYVSVSRAFEEGRAVAELVKEGLLHPRMAKVIAYNSVYRHQEETLRATRESQDVLIATGTGSGKTESFLYPILDRILRAEDQGQAKGVMALIVYPMNALATDQLERLRELLVGTGISFGMYTGETPPDRGDAPYTIEEVPPGTSREAFGKLAEKTKAQENIILHPHEERFTRKMIQDDPPRILLTNTRMLEYLLTRADDLRFLRGAPLDFLVVDEAHTNSGALGAEVALLLRRVKNLAKDKARIQHMAASATIADSSNRGEGQRFMARLFGTEEEHVQMVYESYATVDWHKENLHAQFPRAPKLLFEETLQALENPDDQERTKKLDVIYQELTNHDLPTADKIEERLYEGFLRIDYARAIYEAGAEVDQLDGQIERAWQAAGRGNVRDRRDARWEYLTYLALGAAAQRDGTPLIRPKLHFFVKGLEDAVVVFHPPMEGRTRYFPKLYLSPEAAQREHEAISSTAMFPIKSCPRCGQHHYEAWLDLEDVEERESLGGGTQTPDGEGVAYHPDPSSSKARILFTDSILQDTGEYETDHGTKKHVGGLLCRQCGALHTGAPKRCGSCTIAGNHELVPVQILDSLQKVTSCPVCGYGAGWGAGRREDPFRALSENTARNIYVLAQDMLALAPEESRKLIVFADNRQDAAFQAGSMRDNSRVFRLRRMIHSYMEPDSSDDDPSVEALVDRLVKDLNKDEALARFVAPEVFEASRGGPVSGKRTRELKRFISIQVLQELARPYTDRTALESLGQLEVDYAGLDPKDEGIRALALAHELDPKDVYVWLKSLLHQGRRRQFLTHSLLPELFTQSWKDKRNDLVREKYLPPRDFYPGGWVLEWDRTDLKKPGQIQPFIGRNSAIENWAKSGLGLLEPEPRQEFLAHAWNFLTQDTETLRCIPNLKYSDGKRIKGSENVYHMNGEALILGHNDQRWECRLCKRLHGHPTPGDACTANRCQGQTVPLDDGSEPRDYDLVLLGQKRELNAFVMAEEHTAQVPKDRRQEIERRFKKGSGVNTLVATPTLELGVDIGPLDMVLMRNIPPTSSNYWQRSGRAGRRNRMSVIYSYARNNAHDIHYYQRPDQILGGAIKPPRFNLRNPVMLRKHVHAALMTWFQGKLAGRDDNWVSDVFPSRVGELFFAEGKLSDNIDGIVQPFQQALDDEIIRGKILAGIRTTFQEGWPDDPRIVADETLDAMIQEAPRHLLNAYRRVWGRLRWAQKQIQVIAAREARGESIEDDESRFQRRCRNLIRAYNPNVWEKDEVQKRNDQSYTLKVLAVEGYLPGYATTQDSVTASAHQAYSPGWEQFEFDLNRNLTVAIREHIPGNRIYANGGRYEVTNYLFPADEDARAASQWHMHPETGAIRAEHDITSAENMAEWVQISSLPLVDTSLQYLSHIDADETTRFRLSSQVSGVIHKDHDGGFRYKARDGRVLDHRKGQRITLVNLGSLATISDHMGFPICRHCGAVRSPFVKDAKLEHFIQYHEKLHKQAPDWYALHARATVDGIAFPGLGDSATAASMGEALTLAASQLLDMERDDLQWFIQQQSEDELTLFLYDPMPGGSGLLHQLLDEWKQLLDIAAHTLQKCPGVCETSCYHCLKTYYNQFWHEELNREKALEGLGRYAQLGEATTLEPVTSGAQADDEPVNKWEHMLEQVVTNDWGYHGFKRQGRIELGRTARIPHTLPDLIHEKAKVAIYLDGGPHFSYAAIKKDQTILFLLEGKGWLVVRVPIGDFGNDQLMEIHRQRIEARMAAL